MEVIKLAVAVLFLAVSWSMAGGVAIEIMEPADHLVVGEGYRISIRCTNATTQPVRVSWAEPWYAGLQIDAKGQDGKDLPKRVTLDGVFVRSRDIELMPGESSQAIVNLEAVNDFARQIRSTLKIGLFVANASKDEGYVKPSIIWSEPWVVAVRPDNNESIMKKQIINSQASPTTRRNTEQRKGRKS